MGTLQTSDKSVSAPRNGFDIPRILGGIAQGSPELIHSHVEAMLEIDECTFLPDLLTQLFARNHFAGVRQQD